MNKKPIDRWTFRYTSFKTYTKFCHWLFYRRMQVKFRDRIKKGVPIIFAPNHQNALMDALAVLYTSNRDPVFVARADVFRKKFLANVFHVFKIFPIYRLRDGVGELQKNEEIFQRAIEVLDRGKCPFVIMPEGNHGNKKQLRPLVKGIFRVAFPAQEKYGEQPGIQIIPVGIDYSKYANFRASILIQYGEPIQVSEYFKAYREDTAKGINKIRNRLSEEMRKYIIDIKSTDHYHSFNALKDMYNKEMRHQDGLTKKDLFSRFLASKKILARLEQAEAQQPERIRELDQKVRNYQKGIKIMNIRDWIFERNGLHPAALLSLSLVLLISLPLFLYGLIMNILPYRAPNLVTKKIKDKQFHSSVKLVMGLFLFPVYYLILFAIFSLTAKAGWLNWVFLASLPVTGLLAHEWYIGWKKISASWKYMLNRTNTKSRIPSLIGLRKEIIEQMHHLAGENHAR